MIDLTKHPWRVSVGEGAKYGAIVADVPCRPDDKVDEVYGGYLVCESVSGDGVKRLIAASPESLDLLKRIQNSGLIHPLSIIGRDLEAILLRIESP